MTEIVQLHAESLSIPMKSPFESARRRVEVAENVLVRVTLGDGTVGWGEGSPTPYVTGEDAGSVLDSMDAAAPALLGADAARFEHWGPALREALPGQATARSAVEMAVLDALTRSRGVPLWIHFGGATREIRTDLSIPICPPAQAGEIAGEAARTGYTCLKIKIGGPDRGEDRERVLAASRAAPAAHIRLDANQAFDPDEALAFLRECLDADVPVELLEQPVPAEDLEALAAVTRRSPVPVIADEAVVDAPAALRVAAAGAAHGINVKLAKAGLIDALRIIAIARAAGLKLMLGCMLESLLGIGAAVHLACGTGAFDYLDLDSHTLIGLRAEGRPFAQEGEVIRVDDQEPGIGWAQPGSL